jgi:alkylated DNA repair dioxygenase AlkB
MQGASVEAGAARGDPEAPADAGRREALPPLSAPAAAHTSNGMTSTNLLPRDGLSFLVAEALSGADADRLLRTLLDGIAWRQEEAVLMGRRLPVPRLTAWHGEAGYAYSGISHPPQAWTPPLLELRALAERLAGASFNSVLLNLYRDGRDSVSWHADNEASLGPEPVIASFSLGAVRRFQLRHRAEKSLKVAVDLPHGSCLVMAGATQRCWLHQLPKTAAPVGPRVNLTYRLVSGRPAGGAEQELRPQDLRW